MKNGFNYHGAEIDTMGGSFGRVQSSAQWGKQYDQFAVYGALEGVHDDGFRNFSASDVRRFYGDVGYKNDTSEFHLNMGAADNDFGATATAPIELLQQYWGATYTTPQTTENRVGYVNLTGRVEATPAWTIEGTAHARIYDQSIVDANSTGTQPCAADPTLLCFGNGVAPANGLNGMQLANSFPGAVLGEIDRTMTHSTTTGVSLQATNSDQLFGHTNKFVVGTSFIQRDPVFGQRGVGNDWPELCRHRQRHISWALRQSGIDRPGRPSRHQSVHRALCPRYIPLAPRSRPAA